MATTGNELRVIAGTRRSRREFRLGGDPAHFDVVHRTATYYRRARPYGSVTGLQRTYPVLCSPAAMPLIVAPSGYSRFAKILSLLLAPQEFDLDQAHRIDIRIAQMDGTRQHPVARPVARVVRYAQDHIRLDRKNSSSSMAKTRVRSAEFFTSPE